MLRKTKGNLYPKVGDINMMSASLNEQTRNPRVLLSELERIHNLRKGLVAIFCSNPSSFIGLGTYNQDRARDRSRYRHCLNNLQNTNNL